MAGGGLIPARAGNTKRKTSGIFSTRAHPRSRGEHFDTLGITHPKKGSSPLARGTRRVTSWITDPWGLIPARAGNT